ncbi:MAG: hypothetical protein E7322_02830 [Clostridiales bacterium]|nr:hypothetical protein [Clostridiales bacterium]
MKSFAKFLTGVAFVIVALLAYYIYTSNLPVVLDVHVQSASEKQEEFSNIQRDVEAGKYENVSALYSIDSYSFVTLTVSAKNFSPFPAEWAQFVPKTTDADAIVLLTDAGPKDIGRFKEATFTVTILTSSPETYRTGWLEYYILGRFHSVEAAQDR